MSTPQDDSVQSHNYFLSFGCSFVTSLTLAKVNRSTVNIWCRLPGMGRDVSLYKSKVISSGGASEILRETPVKSYVLSTSSGCHLLPRQS